MRLIRDVSCTSGVHYGRELRGARPNPVDFRSVIEKVREKTFLFLKSIPYYSTLVFFVLT